MSDFRRHLEASVEDPEFKREWDVQAAEREVMTCVSEGCPGVCLPAAPARVGRPSFGYRILHKRHREISTGVIS